jgi:hypothetical protein
MEFIMDTVSRFRAMAAFCLQQSKMEGEDRKFWLKEADDWSARLGKLPANGVRRIATGKVPRERAPDR